MDILNGLASPFMVGSIKLWPVHSRPDFQWFIAYQGKPYYFRSKQEAILFAKDAQSGFDPNGLVD